MGVTVGPEVAVALGATVEVGIAAVPAADPARAAVGALDGRNSAVARSRVAVPAHALGCASTAAGAVLVPAGAAVHAALSIPMETIASTRALRLAIAVIAGFA